MAVESYVPFWVNIAVFKTLPKHTRAHTNLAKVQPLLNEFIAL
jgi:hypothetical protein